MIVIDASVAVKWIVSGDEKFRENANEILKKHTENENIIIIPSLLYLEVANTLVYKSLISQEKLKASLNFLNNLNLKIHSFTKEDYIDAAIQARKYSTTIYDMLYAVIARRNKTTLVTADENFIKKTGFKYVKHIKDY